MIDISIAIPSDSKLLSVLFRTVYIDTYGTEGVTYEFSNFMDHQFSQSKIEKDISSSHSDLWVAKYKNHPVGIVQVEYKNPSPITGAIYPEINKLYILTRFNGQGIGQRLMQTAEAEILAKRNNKVWLWVLESNQRAVNFYLQQGYKEIGTADFQMEVNNYKNLVMFKNL